MARLRAVTQVWDAEATINAGIQSEGVDIGEMTNVLVMIENTAANAVTVEIQVGGEELSAGRNTPPTTWYTLQDIDGAADLDLSVPGNSAKAFDLSPFTGLWLRLSAVPDTPGSQGTLTAFVQCVQG